MTMNRRKFLAKAGAGMAGTLLTGSVSTLLAESPAPARNAASSAGRRSRKPNIVLFFSDDQGWPDLGCFGSETVRSPHLDRLAAGGVRLTNFYVTSSVCTPSRSGLLTGRYPHRNGLYENIRSNMTNYDHRYNELEYVFSPEMTQGLDVREVTIAQALKAAGYRTGIFGKWDSGRSPRFLPLQRGFDVFYGFANTGVDYWTHERYGIPSMFRGNRRVKEQGYATDLFKREALKFIEANRDRPFFLYVPFNAPHGASNLEFRGAQAPDEYITMYGELPGTKRERYMAAITCMDTAIGEILARLEDLGLSENTLVLFASDNGGGGSNNQPLRGGKGRMYEGGIRVPFIASWPGHIRPGTVSDEFCSTLDLFPAFLGIAGARPPRKVTLDGYDMLPILIEGAASQRTEQFWELRANRAARIDKWKWVLDTGEMWVLPEDDTGELYDLSVDIGEQHNLAAERPEVLRMVRGKWEAWMREMAASEPRGPFSRAYFDKLGFGDGSYRMED